MENLFYEVRPYLLMAIGLKATSTGMYSLMGISGMLLIATSAYVILCRMQNRKEFQPAPAVRRKTARR